MPSRWNCRLAQKICPVARNRRNSEKISTCAKIMMSTVAEPAMICAECFHAKGHPEAKALCHNPKCHFYLRTQAMEDGVTKLSASFADLLSLNREVGHSRGSNAVLSSDLVLQTSQKDALWGFQLIPTAARTLQSQPSIFSPSGSHAGARRGGVCHGKARSLSISDHSRIPTATYAEEKSRAKMMRSRARMLSVPVSSSLLDESDLVDAAVEDAFLNSPLPAEFRGGDAEHLSTTSESDSGIGSPFGRPPLFLDWLEPTRRSSHSSARLDVPDLPPFSTTTALDSTTTAANRSSPATSGLPKKLMSVSGTLPTEAYSRKVFIGGLPQDIDEGDIRKFFLQFGYLTIDWPHKSQSKSSIPPKGYAFLLFKEESCVHKLLLYSIPEGDKYFMYIPTGPLAKKKIQIRPWHVSDSQYTADNSQHIDSRKAVFVGGVPRPLKSSELAQVMNEKYGNVVFVAIDCDAELKYPKGAACVVFSTHASYIAAVSARFMQLTYGSLDKKVELKPYVLDNQLCDECHGVQCNGKPAPFFCGSVTCLQYYCEYCWATIHSMPGRQNHRPLLKDIGERARFY